MRLYTSIKFGRQCNRHRSEIYDAVLKQVKPKYEQKIMQSNRLGKILFTMAMHVEIKLKVDFIIIAALY